MASVVNYTNTARKHVPNPFKAQPQQIMQKYKAKGGKLKKLTALKLRLRVFHKQPGCKD